MKILLFFGLAIMEYVMISLLTNKLTKLKEYVTINYSSFEFSDIGEKQNGLNILIKVIFPTIFMIICSGLLYNLGLNILVKQIYLISIFYYLVRWFVIVFFLNRKELINWKEEICLFLITSFISICIYYFFINRTTQIFISINELRDAIWIGIITFIFVIIRNLIYNYTYIDELKLENRKEKYILKKYEYFRNKYKEIVKTRDKQLHVLVYAVMIYENFNRPIVVRLVEKIKFLLTGNATLGIMQVNSRVLINDKTSVEIGYDILKKSYSKNQKRLKEKEDIINETISSYNGGEKYLNEVIYIKGIIEQEILGEE